MSITVYGPIEPTHTSVPGNVTLRFPATPDSGRTTLRITYRILDPSIDVNFVGSAGSPGKSVTTTVPMAAGDTDVVYRAQVDGSPGAGTIFTVGANGTDTNDGRQFEVLGGAVTVGGGDAVRMMARFAGPITATLLTGRRASVVSIKQATKSPATKAAAKPSTKAPGRSSKGQSAASKRKSLAKRRANLRSKHRASSTRKRRRKASRKSSRSRGPS